MTSEWQPAGGGRRRKPARSGGVRRLGADGVPAQDDAARTRRANAAARGSRRREKGSHTQRLRRDPETALAMSSTHQTSPVRKMTPTIRSSRTFTAGTYRSRKDRPDRAVSVVPGAEALVFHARMVPAQAGALNSGRDRVKPTREPPA